MAEFTIEYFCVLHDGCDGRGHSISCQELNQKRAKRLRSDESRRRVSVIEAELARKTCSSFATAWDEGWQAAQNGSEKFSNPYGVDR